MVGMTRLELATSRPPAVRATNCATPRYLKNKYLAEGWGFEPQIDFTAYTRFPSVLLQPLGHPSRARLILSPIHLIAKDIFEIDFYLLRPMIPLIANIVSRQLLTVTVSMPISTTGRSLPPGWVISPK